MAKKLIDRWSRLIHEIEVNYTYDSHDRAEIPRLPKMRNPEPRRNATMRPIRNMFDFSHSAVAVMNYEHVPDDDYVDPRMVKAKLRPKRNRKDKMQAEARAVKKR